MARLTRYALLTAMAVLAGGAGARTAHADLIRTVPFSVIGPGSATVALPQFNPARGTLNSVSVNETATDQFVLEIFNSGAGTYQASADNTFTFGLGGPGQPGVLSASGTIPRNKPIFVAMPAAVSLGTLMIFFPPDAVSFFIGTGTYDTSVSLSRATLTSFSGSSVNAILAFAGVKGRVTLDYAFTPAVSVTEPASGLLLVSVLGVLAGVAVRRSRS